MPRVRAHVLAARAFHNVMVAYAVCVESVGSPVLAQGSAPTNNSVNANGRSVGTLALDYITDVDNAISAALADYLTPEEWSDIKNDLPNKVAERKIGRLFIARGLYPVKGYFTR